MPAPLTSIPARTTSKTPGNQPNVNSHSKKTRIVRRRGRAKGPIESDDDIEREVGTDSDSDNDRSSLDSDSDPESVSQIALPNGHSHLSTPSTTQSPGERTPVDNEAKPIPGNVETSFFVPGNWSEMVAEETANGPAELPVIDFADLYQHGIDRHSRPTPRPRRKSKTAKKLPTAQSATATAPASVPSAPSSIVEDRDEPENDGHTPSSSRQPPHSSFARRELGQSARQAYQQRLETDPSYVPTVGEFWGHDDRLLDKDLRSLSSWWRGRWQGRGRGRGFYRGFATRARGKGTPSGYHGPMPPPQDTPESKRGDEEIQSAPPDPVEQAWTHDGFEEMKRKDERRLDQEHLQPPQFRGFGGFRGGRALGRGRGGGFMPSPTRSRFGLPFVPSPGKTWFAMKPERVWTKQHDAFLYLDPALKPRPGQGPAFRVKMPGNRVQIIRAPFKPSSPTIPAATKLLTASVIGSEDGEKVFVVRIPRREGKQKAPEHRSPATQVPDGFGRTAEEPPIDDAFTVRPWKAVSSSKAPIVNGAPSGQPSNQAESALSSLLPDQRAQQQLEQLSIQPSSSDQARWAQTEEAVLRNPMEPRTDSQPVAVDAQSRPSHAVLPPLQTVFPTISQSPPSFGSHFAYGPSLPPGIAMNQHGIPYELATGHPVYLQPPPVYNPRPVMHTHIAPPNFVPGHMHHHSAVSPDFLSHPSPHTHSVNGFIDPSSGSPMFSLPRSSRIEIRAPTEQSEGKASDRSFSRRPSSLRTASSASDPSSSIGDTAGQNYFVGSVPFASVAEQEGGRVAPQSSTDPAVMSYPLYQHQYYYPEAYGYSPYMDMSQVTPYEMYPPDPRVPPTQAVYY